jgi:PIN domain nuclease of toxin-antitoxin system
MPEPRQALQTRLTNRPRFIGIVTLRARRLSSSRPAQEIGRAAVIILGTAMDDNRGTDSATSARWAGAEVWPSAASICNVAIRHGLGRLRLPEPIDRWVPNRLQIGQTGVFPVDAGHALGIAGLPPLHRDSFDRLIVARAVVEELPLLTTDAAPAHYGIPLIASFGNQHPCGRSCSHLLGPIEIENGNGSHHLG